MKIILTNWTNLLGVFLVTLAFSCVLVSTDANLSYNILQTILAALFSVLGYGMLAWVLFIALLVILDLVFIIPIKENVRTKLLIEWLIISVPFIYWAVKYDEWIFIAAIMAFLITQLLREKRIAKITQ